MLLDRDGVVNEDVGSPGVVRPEDLVLTRGCAEAVAALNTKCRVPVALCTNQSAVGKGVLSVQGLAGVHHELARQLAAGAGAKIDAVLVAPGTEASGDPWRKPRPDMLLHACRRFRVEPGHAVFVGDTLGDLRAANAAGVGAFVLVRTGYGLETERRLRREHVEVPPSFEVHDTLYDWVVQELGRWHM